MFRTTFNLYDCIDMNMTNTHKFWIISFLLSVTVYVYYPYLWSPFVFDDWDILVKASFIRDPSRWYLEARPLRNLSYLLDLHFGPLVPHTFHLSNLVYHLMNVALMSYLMTIIFRPKIFLDFLIPIGLASILSLHPAQFESVVYISGRKEILYSFFYLSGLVAFWYFYQRKLPHAAWWSLILFFFLSKSAKESGITIFGMAILLFYEMVLSEKFNTSLTKRINVIKIICLIAALPFILLYLSVDSQGSKIALDSWMGGSPLAHYQNAAILFWKYIYIAFYPHELAVDYSAESFNEITGVNITAILSIFVIMILCLLSIKIWWKYNKSNLPKDDLYLMALGWLWFCLVMMPMSNLLPYHERFAIHYLYLPMIGLFISLTAGIRYIFKRYDKQHVTVFILGLLIIFYSVRSVTEMKWWLNEIDFYEHNTYINPRCIRAQVNLGNTYLKFNKLAEAREAFESAQAVKPTSDGSCGLVKIYLEENNIEKAKNELRSIKFHHDNKELLMLKGLVALADGNIPLSESIAQNIHQKDLSDPDALYLLGKISSVKKDHEAARQYYQKAYASYKYNRQNGLALLKTLTYLSHFDHALLLLEEGQRNGLWRLDEPDRLNDMGFIFERMGKRKDAIPLWEKALTIDPNCLVAALNLSTAFLQEKSYQRVIELMNRVNGATGKNSIKAHIFNNIGVAFARLNKPSLAINAFQEALKLEPNDREALSNLQKMIKDHTG
ncbi:MAG: tetratricopeptide repeat protein [Calditrichaceae bacterium]